MYSDISILNCLPLDRRNKFKSVTTEIVVESFVFTADRDYLTARFAFFEKQGHLFLWSAAQAVEKYLKANILLLDMGVIKKSHKLIPMVKTIRTKYPERLSVCTSIPDGWAERGVGYWPIINIDDYLTHLEMWGAPSIRYDQNGFNLNLQHLVLLDRLVYQLRERLIGEKVSECKFVSEQILNRFYDFNFSFAPEGYQHPSLEGLTLASSSVSTLEAALKDLYGHSGIYEMWATKYLGLTSKDIELVRSAGCEN